MDILNKLRFGLDLDITCIEKQVKTIENIEQKYSQLAELCAYKTLDHPKWGMLAGRIKTEELKNKISRKFSETTEKSKILLYPDYYNFVMKNKDILDNIIIEERDYNIDWFGVCTAIKSYLLKLNGETVESVQQMFLRVATWTWMNTDTSTSACTMFEKIREVYDDLSLHNYMCATPTLFNSGLRRPQCSSCFLMTIQDDTAAISKSWHDCAIISQGCGGIGIDISDIRHSKINNSLESSGVVPMLKCHNAILNYIDQGGKRKGSATIYISDYHIDIFEFLELRKTSGSDSVRARELFYALWVSDLFMKRVENNEMWSLFCPNIAKGLNDVWGKEFEELYERYEKEHKYNKQIEARKLWQAIYVSWVEVGMPFILYKDASNRKSNQQNLGTIRCSNLCTEILQFTSKDEISNCNLSNISLKSCVVINEKHNLRTFDFSKLERLARALVRNINEIIDKNYYPETVPEIKNSNLRHRPMGIGVQGLADTLALMDLSWKCDDARKLNILIFETIYYGAVTESIKISKELTNEKMNKLQQLKNEHKLLIETTPYNEISKKQADLLKKIMDTEKIITTYSSFEGSPASKGLLQFDLWAIEEFCKKTGESIPFAMKNYSNLGIKSKLISDRYNWKIVSQNLKKSGMRNSLLLALMPTASTAHLIGNNEAFEPFFQMVFARTVLSGQFMIVNKYMVSDFEKLSIWNKDLSNDIIRNDGSIQELNISDYKKDPTEQEISRFDFLKEKYLTAFELPQKILAQFGVDRGQFICQTQSFNCFMKQPTYQKMTSFMFFQWKNGAKTGMYYLRSMPPASAMKYTLPSKNKIENIKKYTCTEDVCIMCQ